MKITRISFKNSSINYEGGLFLMFIVAIIPLIFHLIRWKYPIGYAGLYSLIIQTIVDQNGALPTSISNYSSGSIPFAYPPLTFYIGAFFTGFLNLPPRVYLILAPILSTLLASYVLFLLAKRIINSKLAALSVVFVFLVSPTILNYHATAAGIVRGWALLFSLTSLLFLYIHLNESGRQRDLLIAAIFMAATGLSHLTYFLFLTISILIFFIRFGSKNPGRLLKTLLIFGAASFFLLLPWIWLITKRHGLEVFLFVFSTHGGIDFFHLIQKPLAFLIFLLRTFISMGSVPLCILIFAGFFLSLQQRNWFLPVWLVSVRLFVGEGDRFLILVGSILSGWFIYVFFHALSDQYSSKKLLRVAGAAIPLVLIVNHYIFSVPTFLASRPSLSDQLISTGRWMANQDSDRDYLFLTSDQSLAEWLPYLSNHKSVICPWGAEWTNSYFEHLRLAGRMNRCLESGSPDCIKNLMTDNSTFLVLPIGSTFDRTDFQEFHEAYGNSGFLVLEKE